MEAAAARGLPGRVVDLRCVGIDLRAQRWRPYLQAARQLTSTADGVILGLDSAQHALRLVFG